MANDRSLKQSLLLMSPFLFKIFELVLVLISLSLIITPFGNKLQSSVGRAGFIYCIYGSAIIVNCLVVSSHFFKEQIQKKTCLTVTAFFGLFLMITGIMIIHDWKHVQITPYTKISKNHMDMFIASGVFSIFSSVSYFIDLCLIIKYN